MRTGTRTSSLVAATALSLVLAAVAPALAGPDDGLGDNAAPTEQDVVNAEAAVHSKAADVDTVQTQLALAQDRLRKTEIAAAMAAEEFNEARYRAQQAGRAARAAQDAADEAGADLAAQREAYVDAINVSYQLGPSLSPLAALGGSGGVSDVLQDTSLIQQAAAAIENTYDEYEATEALARAADERAESAYDEAAAAKAETKAARDDAAATAADAATQTAAYAADRDRLIGELADLQDISVAMAREHQEALEQAAAEAAAEAAAQAAADAAAQAAAEAAAEQAAQDAADAAAEQAAEDAEPTPDPEPTATPPSDPTPTTPTPPTPSQDPEPTPESTPDPTPPAPSGGAAAAIAFAQAQLGEPYRYGASGPASWDCSGLTMRSWAAGGKTIPRTSRQQYAAATPIAVGDLQPGDLLFWGSSPSSIYHVAMYVGGGQMIHAPRTGRNVEQVSMYYWIAPNYFGRP